MNLTFYWMLLKTYINISINLYQNINIYLILKYILNYLLFCHFWFDILLCVASKPSNLLVTYIYVIIYIIIIIIFTLCLHIETNFILSNTISQKTQSLCHCFQPNTICQNISVTHRPLPASFPFCALSRTPEFIWAIETRQWGDNFP